MEVRNLLVLGCARRPRRAHTSNWSVGPEAFVNAAAHNYALAPGAPATDAGIAMTGVTTDRIGTTRPQGLAYDVGAYEAIPATVSGPEVVLHAANASTVAGNWRVDAGSRPPPADALRHPNANASTHLTCAGEPDALFRAQRVRRSRTRLPSLAARARGREQRQSNDAVWVQFSNAVSSEGTDRVRHRDDRGRSRDAPGLQDMRPGRHGDGRTTATWVQSRAGLVRCSASRRRAFRRFVYRRARTEWR